jgi:hypothetical protein
MHATKFRLNLEELSEALSGCRTGMTKFILEIDSTTVAKAIMSMEFDRSMNGALFR